MRAQKHGRRHTLPLARLREEPRAPAITDRSLRFERCENGQDVLPVADDLAITSLADAPFAVLLAGGPGDGELAHLRAPRAGAQALRGKRGDAGARQRRIDFVAHLWILARRGDLSIESR